MVRSYLTETSVQQCIERIICQQQSCIGLVIGQMQAAISKDFIVHIVPTPSPPSASSSDVSSTKREWLSLDSVDEHYVANHARQVTRMLMGGFDVIGIFVCAKPDDMKNAQTKLRQIIFAAHKVLAKMDVTIANGNMHGDRVLMQICPLTKKITCRTYDVTDIKSTSVPAELKFQKFVDGFQRLATTFTIDTVVPVAADSMSFTLSKQILNGLQPLFENVWRSLAIIDGRLIQTEDEPLCVKPLEKSKSKKRQREDEVESKTFTVDLLQQMNPSCHPSGDFVTECGARLIVRGTIAAKAFVHAKATAADAIQSLKKDIIRSVIARCELLCEDLLQAEEEQDVKILYETPLRVFTSLPDNTSVEFCDYLFPDEDVTDSASRFRELVGIDIDDEDVETNLEHLPTDTDLAKPTKPVWRKRHARSTDAASTTLTSKQLFRYLGLGVSVVVASVAGFVSYWYSLGPSNQEQ